MLRIRPTLVLLALVVLALSCSGMAQKADTYSSAMFGLSTTTGQTALLLPFVSSINGGTSGDAAISVSNTLGAPSGSGFPAGGDREGGVSFYCYNNASMMPYVFKTTDNPTVGTGATMGMLGPGNTYTVLASEVIGTLFPDDPMKSFSGYCWVVGNFDAMAGSATNFFPGVGGGLNYTATGNPVDVTP